MPATIIRTVAAAGILTGFLSATLPSANAESLACQTVNGKTVCMRGSGQLICETIDGDTRCRSEPAPPPAEAFPPLPSFPDLSSGPVVVERDGMRVRVYVGGVEVRID